MTDDGLTAAIWRRAREGDLRGGAEAARIALSESPNAHEPGTVIDLRLIAAFCAMRGGDLSLALRELDAAALASSTPHLNPMLGFRVEIWRAELAYFQGRYSAANEIIDRLVDRLENSGDFGYAAFALRIRIAILLARADHSGAIAHAERALRNAKASGDDYVLVQILNILGTVHFDAATSKLAEPHARAHLSSLDLRDTAAMTQDAREALRLFEEARVVAERARYEFAAWYVAGNIERLEIVLGHAERVVRAIRKRLSLLQQRGARYDEIVTRSNLAWALRTLGHYREALRELDAALSLARTTGTFNVLLEFLEYDRSIVLDALGDGAGAQTSYRRYLRLVAGHCGEPMAARGRLPKGVSRRPLEPYFMKRADRYVVDCVLEPLPIERLAGHCGVSARTLEKAFSRFRGLTPVAYVRNVRLDHARRALEASDASVREVAERFGFRSPTTFAIEYRKRFGIAPRQTKRGDPSRRE